MRILNKEEFKIEPVKHVTEPGHAVVDVLARFGVSGHSLYQWVKQYSIPSIQRDAIKDQQARLGQLKAVLGSKIGHGLEYGGLLKS